MAEQVPNPFAAPQVEEVEARSSATSDAEAVRREHLKHETSVQGLGSLYLLGGLLAFVMGGFMLVGGIMNPGGADPLVMPYMAASLGLVYCLLGGMNVWGGWYCRRLDARGKLPATISAVIGLIGIPIGTLISAYFLYLLYSEKGKMVFSEEYARIRRATPHIKHKTSMVVWFFVAVLLGALVAVVLRSGT